VSRQRRAAGGELGVLGGEEVHRQVQTEQTQYSATTTTKKNIQLQFGCIQFRDSHDREEQSKENLLLPGGEVEHGVGELDLAADAAERLEAGGGLAHRQRLRRVLPRPLELTITP
jgi:hypothetical protein